MTGEQHFREAEKLAEQARKLLGQGDGQATAAVWAAVAQVHATLALASAAGAGSGRARQQPAASSQANTAAEPYLEASTPGLIPDVTKGGPMPRFSNPT